ncbi:MAG: glycosyl hydrolase [Negativicutes bacterium]|nr:glycosyl hydrolase [Negativicutes bacterium]
MKKWDVLLIHHSHTDVGYTDRQEKIERHHVANLELVVDILNEAHRGGRQEWQGFKWTCESFWCVEKFLTTAPARYVDDFADYVRRGQISVSGNYLNCAEILDADVFDRTLKRCTAMASRHGIRFSCAMTADINGYGWGYADVLLDNGMENLLTCLHTHHGYHPTGRKQRPFFWQTPRQRKLLVWLGDHYHLGNEMAIHGLGGWGYTLKADNLDRQQLPAEEIGRRRLFDYLRCLEEEDYPFDFVPITVSGLMTDNSPPSVRIIEFVHRWNRDYGDRVSFQMATLEELFAKVREHANQIETFSGDWPDWWSDGVGSTPLVLKHYRDAQRKYYICSQLDRDGRLGSPAHRQEALDYLMLYAEHTWGHSASVNQPWGTIANDTDLRKTGYAVRAHEAASRDLDCLTFACGETGIAVDRPLSFKVINPHDRAVTEVARVQLETLFGHEHFQLVDDDSGQAVRYQLSTVPRGWEVCWPVRLAPKQEKTFSLRELDQPPLVRHTMRPPGGVDGVNDLAAYWPADDRLSPDGLSTDQWEVAFTPGQGVTGLYHRPSGISLLRAEREYNLFTPVYEVTDGQEMDSLRRSMGRNRKTFATCRTAGQLINVTTDEQGRIYSRVTLHYRLPGTSLCRVVLTVYRELPRIDFVLQLHKHSVWQPENLYLALPLTTGCRDEVFYIDKMAAVVRPRIDQLPGSCTDFYAVENGMAFVGGQRSLVIATTDAPLISLGTLAAHPIRLAGEPGCNNIDHLYSWVMNNFWETNFKATLGGFHEYRYSLLLADRLTPADGLAMARAVNCGFLAFPRFAR